MFDVIDKETTKSLSNRTGHGVGMTEKLRKQFSAMEDGESFIYPVGETEIKRAVYYSIRGTSRHLGVKIKTKSMREGFLVVKIGRL